MKRYKDTLIAILFILTIVGTLAFTEWVLLKDYEPKKAELQIGLTVVALTVIAWHVTIFNKKRGEEGGRP